MAGHGVADCPTDVADDRPGRLELEVVGDERLDEQQGDRATHLRDRRRNGVVQGECRVLREDHPMQRAGLGGRLETPLHVEGAARRLVRVECLLLPAGPCEREHQETAEALAVGVLRGERGSIGDHVVLAPELDLGLDAVLERREPELVQPRDLCLEEALEAEVGERRAAPEPERVAEPGGALRRWQRPRLVDEPFEPSGVDRPGLDAEHVPGARVSIAAFPSRRRSRETAFCTTASAVGGGAPRPEIVDQGVRGDDRARVQDEVGRARRAVSGLRAEFAPDLLALRAGLVRGTQRRSPFRVRRRYSSTRPKYRQAVSGSLA